MGDSLPVTIALIVLLLATMLTVGTELTISGFVALLRRPLALIVAVLVNTVLVPAVAVLLTAVLRLDAPVALGLILAAAAPGGGTGTLLTYHARGDLALGVGLQGVLAVLGLVSVPAWTLLASPYGGAVVSGSDGSQVVLMLIAQLLPIGGGMWMRSRRPALAQRLGKVSRRVADLLLVTMTIYILVTTADRLADIPAAGFAAFLLLALASLGTYAAPGLGTPPARRAVAMTTTVRNLSMALLVAAISTDAPQVSLTVLAYGLVMYVASALALIPLRRTSA